MTKKTVIFNSTEDLLKETKEYLVEVVDQEIKKMSEDISHLTSIVDKMETTTNNRCKALTENIHDLELRMAHEHHTHRDLMETIGQHANATYLIAAGFDKKQNEINEAIKLIHKLHQQQSQESTDATSLGWGAGITLVLILVLAFVGIISLYTWYTKGWPF